MGTGRKQRQGATRSLGGSQRTVPQTKERDEHVKVKVKKIKIKKESESRSVVSDSAPGQNPGAGSRALLQMYN